MTGKTGSITRADLDAGLVDFVTAILLGRRFGTTPRFWMNLQVAHDLEVAAGKMAA